MQMEQKVLMQCLKHKMLHLKIYTKLLNRNVCIILTRTCGPKQLVPPSHKKSHLKCEMCVNVLI